MKIFIGLNIFLLFIFINISGYAQPVISTNPTFFSATLGCNDSITQNLTINNTGSSTLSFSTFFKYAYVCNSDDNTVSVIDVTTNTIIGVPIPVGQWPMQAAISPDAQYVYVSSRDEYSVYVIQTSSNTVVDTIVVGYGSHGLAFTPDGNFLYVCNQYDNTVSVVECSNNTVISTIYDTGLNDPFGVAVSPDGKKVYVASRNSGITVIDVITNTVITNILGFIRPLGIVFTPDGKYAFISEAASSGSVVQVDVSTNTIIKKIGIFDQAVGIDLTPDGKYIYAVDKGIGSVQIIEVSSGNVVDTISNSLLIGGWGLAISPDGRYAYIGITWNSPSLIILDINNKTVAGSLVTSINGSWGVTTLNNIPEWLTSGIISDTISAGNSTNIGLKFKSTGINTGIYSYDLYVFSNDSVNPSVIIPCTLTIDGPPSMALSDTCLNFDTTYVTGYQDKILKIFNNGCDTLKVTGLSPSAQFTVSSSNLIVMPYDSTIVTVRFSPVVTGNITGSLAITSNDYNTSVCLNGTGKLPPDISVSPSSLSATAIGCVGDTITKLLKIYNTGFDNLDCNITMDQGSYDSTSFIQYFISDATTTHIFPFSLNPDSINIRVIINGDYDSGSESANLYIDGTLIETIPDGNLLETDIIRNYAFGGSQLDNWLIDNQIIVTIDNTSGVGAFGSTDYHSVQLWYNGVQWPGMINPIPNQVNIIPGDSATISVDFISTGKNTGVYSTYLFVVSNDPDSPVDTIPCTLTVIGNPEISVSDTCLNFTSTQLGLSSTDTILITNTGCDTLFITAISAAPAVFTFNPVSLPLTVQPGTFITIPVIFTPANAQVYSGNLSISSNAGNKDICLNGTGLPSAIINLIPDSFNVTLTGCNDSITLPLGIYNSGNANLNYTIDISGTQPPTGYCIPIYTYCCPEGCGDGDYIRNFTFNTISNLNSNCNGQANGYIYYSSLTTKVQPGNTYNISMQAGSFGEGFGVWIDYNRDGDFIDAGEFVYASPSSGTGLFSGTVTIPANAATGKTRLRVRCAYSTIIGASAYCSSYTYGETEDYDITIGDIFVSCNPASGTSLPTDTSIVDVKFKSYGLAAGFHYGIITINSDDPVNPAVILPCTLNIVGVPDISISSSSVNYGSIFQYASKTDSVTITNSGCSNLTISNITHLNPAYSIDSTLLTIAPWSSKKIRITFYPQTIGNHYDTLNVLNNDSNLKIPLYGYALSPPVISYSPSSFNVTTANCNDTITLPLTIYNTGNSDLIFTLTVGNTSDFNLDVAITGSDTPANLDDVRNKLIATGKFNSVTIIDVRYSTPTLATLQQYDAIIVWMNYNYNNPTQLGNVLADYVDNGGRVVSAIFETGYSGHLLGRWDSQQYYVITRGSYTSGYTTLGTVLDPGHPIMKNIVSLNGNGSTYRPSNTTLTSTSSLIASWADGKPLVAVKEKNGARLADLGLWPPSSDVGANSWQSSTNGGLLMANALEWVSEFVKWISISSDADTIAAGDSVVVNVTFNTSDLITGNYSASLIINSNDPLSSSDTIPCNLTLNGNPSIVLSDSSINYGSIFQYSAKTDSITISNSGCGNLTISNITHLNPAYSIDSTLLTIAPWSSKKIRITFSPQTIGNHYDTLNILNNDSNIKIPLYGYALSPPVITYSPSSFNVTTANCNDSITLPLTIYNTGDTDLIFSLTGGNVGNFNLDVAVAGSEDANYLNDVRNKLLATGKFNSVTIVDVRNSTPTLATLQQYDAIIVWMDYSYNNPTQLGNVLADYVDNGGGVVSAIFETGYSGHMLGRWDTQEYYVITRGSYTTGYTTLGTVLEPGHPIMKNIVSLNGNGSTYRPNNTALTSTSSLIARWADGKPLVAVKEKNGSRLADLGLWPPSSDIIGNSWQSNTNGGLLMANALEWVSEFVSWLAISSDADTIAAGDSVVVNVTFNTSDLITGNYSASLIINSNDPLSSSDTVLCNLTLNGHPTIVLSDTCINYNPIMQWTNITDSVNISNTGCDTLFVSDITLSNSVFSVNTTNLVIPPDDDVFVHITFSPVTAGIFSDTLRIYNNDVLTEVCINASSYSPPVLAYFPDSLIATVNICNDSVTLPLTIYNPGDTLLNWNSDIINNFTKSSLNLTGSNYVSVTNFTGLPSGSVMTVEAWVYPVGLPDASYNGVVAFGPRVCTGTSFLLSMTNAGRPSFASWCKDFVPTTGPTATLNQWHHIAAVLNGSSIKLYLDGYEWSGSLGTAPNVQPGTLTIGCTDLPGRYFNGRIDEVRIWNQVRTAQQISDLEGVLLNPNDAGLVSYWNFNEGTGTTVADRTGNGHTGNLIGAGWSLTSPQLSNMYLSTTSGSILAGDSSIVNVTFYTSAIDSGTYYESIIINSNDPLNEADTVPTVLFYNGYPVIAASDNCLAYDSLFQYLTVTDTLWISNTGCATLNISNISNSLSAFTTDSAIFSILPGGSKRIIVTFNPLSAGHYYDTLHIFNNDSNINICLHGYALSPPVISLNPDSFYVIINNCNDSVTLPLTISNTGDTTLSWNIISQLNSGSALSFNGSNNYVQIPNSNVFDVTRLTMEAWVYSNNFNQNGFIFEKGPVNTQYSMFFEGASFCFRTVNSSGSLHSQYVNSTTLGLTNGNWYHIACTYDGVNKKIYVNGVLKNTLAYNQILRTGMQGQIIGAYGGTGGHSYYLNGRIDEVRVWNYAKTALEISQGFNQSLIGNESGLIGYWNFNEGSGATLYDLTNYNHDGTITGASWVASGASVQDNIQFNTYSGNVTASDSTLVNVTFYRNNQLSGTYYKQIIINSNDPLSPLDTIPCTLVFTNHPVIEVSDNCLEFDSIFQFISGKDSLWISNRGCDTLFVTDITNSQNEFSFNATSFVISPGDSAKVIVTFYPLTLGHFYDTLHVLNNDSDINICLHGYALSPPVISTNPTLFNDSFGCCDSTIKTLTIYNTGDNDLIFDLASNQYYATFDGNDDYIRVNNTFSGFNTITVEAWIYPTNVSGPHWILSTGRDCCTPTGGFNLLLSGSSLNGQIWRSTGNNMISVGSASGIIVPNVWQHVAMVYDGVKIKLYRNGVLVATSATYASSSILNGSNNLHFGVLAYSVPTYYDFQGNIDNIRIWDTPKSQNLIFSQMYSNLDGNETGLKGYWNFENQNANDVTSFGNNGTQYGNSTFVQYPNDSVSTFENWLNVTPVNDTISPGDSALVFVKLKSCGLLVGNYLTDIIISSNDPLRPKDTIPCSLLVSGSPVITASQNCLVFDSIFQYLSTGDSLWIYNTGCDTLKVTNITNSNNTFIPNITAFTLMPGDSSKISVSFNPVISGLIKDTLHIINNASVFEICLQGYAFSPPVISFNPDSIIAVVNVCNDSVTVPLTIYNIGDTTLTYNIEAQTVNSAGYALQFDGNNDYADMGNWFNYQTFTIEMWVKPGSTQKQYADIIDNNHTGSRSWVLQQNSTNTNQYGWGTNDGGGSALFTLTANQWTHIAITRDGNTKANKVYINGSLFSSYTGTSNVPYDGTQFFRLCRWGGGGREWNGTMDEVRVWNTVRSQQQITQNMNFQLSGGESGMLAYWNIETGSGNSISDISGNGRTGTIQNGAVWTTQNAPLENILIVDSNSGSILAGDSTVINVTFFTDDIIPGTYYREIVVSSNDPLSPTDTIPCTLIYNGYPVISLSDTCLYFDTIMQWETNSQNLVIRNTGCDILQITDITSSLSEFSLSDTSFSLAPGDSSVLTVSFNPVTVDTFNNNIILYTNIGTQSVCLNAVSTPPPVISVNPDSMDVTLTVCNDSAVFPFTIYNSGSVALNYSINAISNIAASLNNYIDTIASGDSSVVNLIIDGTTVTPGTYNFPIEINSNDPLNPFVSIPVTFTVTARPTKPVASDTSICDGSAVPDLFAAGINVNWYNDTSLVFSGNTFTTGDTAIGIYNYYVTQTVDNCESFADTVTLAIYAIPFAPASSDNTICFENTNALLTAAGSNIVWYSDSLLSNQVAIGNNFLTGLTAVGTYTFYLTQTVNNCQSPFDISTLTINPIPAAPVVSDTLICFGNPTPDLITSGENIQWYSDSALQNLIHIGDTLSTGITAAGVYTFYATQTSIAFNCQGHASAATLTIDSLFLPPVVSDNAICYGQVTPAFNATGDSLRWYSDSLLFTLVGTGNSYLPSDTMVGSFTYYLTQNNQCGESTPESATLIIHPIPSAPVSSDQSVCFGYNVPDLVATGTNIIWYSDSLLSNTVYSGNTFTTGQFNVGTYLYYITQTINNCESPADIVSLEIRSTPLIPKVSDTVICFGDSTPDLTATGNYVQWYSDNTLSTLIHTGNIFSSGNTASGVYMYYVTDLDTVAGCESFSDSIKLTINAIPAVPVTNDNSICFGQTTPSFTATGSNIIWYSDTNIVNIGNTYTPADTTIGPYTYFVTQTVNNCESPADTVIFTINPLPPAPLVTDSIICTLNPIPDFIAQGTNIRWYADSTLNNLVYTGDTLTPGISLAGTYNWYVTQTISATGCEGPFETATLTIDTLPFAPVADDHTICYGTPTPVFYSTGSNVMWYDSSLTFILFDGNSYPSPDTAVGTYIYYVKQQNHCGQSTPDTAILIINSNPSAPVGTGSSVCFGSLVPPLTASGATVIWYQDSALTLVLDTTDSYNSGMTNVGTYIYYITLSQNNCQGPSDTVILDIRNIPSEPVSDDEVICFGTTTPDLIATGVNVNWYENSALDSVISTGNTFSTGITTAGSYTFYVTQFDNGNSCESFADTVTLTINSIPSPPVTTDTSICFGQSIPLLMAIGSNIIWYSDTNIVNTGSNFTPADTASGTYNFYVTQTVNNCESPADTVIFTINTLPPAPFVSDTVTCSGSTTPDLIAQGVNINWYNDSLLSTLVYSGDTLSPGVTLSGIYSWYVTQTISATGCEGSYSKVTLTIDSLPFKPIVADQVICFGTVTPSFTAIGTNVKWYSDSALTVIVQTGNNYTSTEDTVGSYVYFVTQSNYCGESSADSAMLTINAIPLLPDASGYSVCFGQPTQTIIATGANIIWYLDSTLSIPIDTANSYNPNISAQGTYTYYLTQTVNACESSADTVVIVIHSLPVPPSASDQYTCTASIPSLIASGTNIQWYDSSGFVYAGDTLVTGQTQYGVYTYYATQTSLATGCESNRDTVLLTISTAIINPPVTNDTASCFGQTVPDLTAQGLNIIWYSDSLLNTQVGTDTVFATGITSPGTYTYWVVQQNICGISPKAEATLTINSLPDTPVSSDTSTCKGNIIALSATGNNLHWYQDITLETLLFTGDNYIPAIYNVPGIYTYYLTDSSFVTGCISNIDSLIFIVKDVPVSPVAENDTACFGGNVPDLTATGTNINWYDDALLTNLVFTGDTFSTGQTNLGVYTYYLTQSNECGASVSDTVVLTISNQPGTPVVSGASVCSGDSSSLSAIGMNINWYSDTALTLLVDTGNYFTPADTAVGTYNWYVTQTNSSTGCISNYSTVSLIINSIPIAPEVTDSTVCQGTANPALTAIGSNITWYNDSALTVIIDTDSIFIPTDIVSGIYNYYTTQTVNSCESPSSLVVFTIKALPASPIATDSSICDGGLIPLFTSSGSNLTWYSDSALTTSIATGSSYQPLVSNPGVYNWYVTQMQNGCEGPYDIATLIINSVPLPPIAVDDTICYGASVPVLNASGANVIWYGNPALTDTLQNGNNYQPTDASAGTHIFYVTQSVNNCISSSNDVIFFVFDSSVPPVASDHSICMGNDASSLTATGVNVQWYSDAALLNLIYSGNTLITNDSLPGTYIYYATQIISTCGISPSDSAILTIKSIPPAPVLNDETICFGNTTPALVATGSDLKWYSEPELIILVNIGTNFNTGNTAVGTYTYYVTQNINGCTSRSNDIVLTINPTPLVTLNKYYANISEGGSVTLIAYNAVNYSWTPVTGLSTATGAVVVASPVQTTTYIVTGTNNQGCFDTAKCVVEVGEISVEENDLAQYLSVYPNPTNRDLKIKFVSLQKESLKIRILNQLGQVLINLQSEQHKGRFEESISLENIADGVYYLQVMADKGVITKKVVLKR